MIKIEDIEKLLRNQGWEQDDEFPYIWTISCGSMHGSYATVIELNSETMKLLEAIYDAGKLAK